MATPERLWTKNLILAALINFQLLGVFFMLLVVIASYAITHLGASTSQAGLISGIFIVGSLVARLITVQIVAVLGQKPTLILTLLGFGICSSLYLIDYSVYFLMFTRFMHGLMFGICGTILSTCVAQFIPASRRGEGIAYYSLSSTLGTALGPFLGIYLSLNISFSNIFICAIVASLLCMCISFLLLLPEPKQHSQLSVDAQKKPSLFSKFIEPKAIPIGLVILISATCYSSVLAFITFYAQQLNLAQTASIFFLVYATAIIVSRPYSGKVMDRKGENLVMYPSLFLLSCGLFVLTITDNSLMLLLCAVILGFGFGNTQSISQAIAVKRCSYEKMGLATSTFYIFTDCGLGFGPFILGYILNYLDYQQMYLMVAVVSFINIGLYFLLVGRFAEQHRKQPQTGSMAS